MGWKETPVILSCGVAISAVAQSHSFFSIKDYFPHSSLAACCLPGPGQGSNSAAHG